MVKPMKKTILVMIMILVLLFTSACASETQAKIPEAQEQEHALTQTRPQELLTSEIELYTLIFNTPEVENMMMISPMPNFDFYLPISQAQVDAIFPVLNLPIDESNMYSALAYYRKDGTLTEISISASLSEDMVKRLGIRIGMSGPPMVFSAYGFANDEVFEESYVHGIPVTVKMVTDSWGLNEMRSFEAHFTIGETVYHVTFSDYKESGQTFMTELVNGLIVSGTSGFDILLDPTIPELRSEEISLSEAKLDADFGVFVPQNIPSELSFQHGFRSIQGHRNENSLHLEWLKPRDDAYLRTVYNNWVNNRISDTPVFSFDQIVWWDNSIRMRISTAQEHELLRVIYAVDFNEYDWFSEPVFLAEELTLDIVRKHVQETRARPQGALWDDGMEEHDTFIPLDSTWIEINVLFGDVLVSVRTGFGNVPPETVWELLEQMIMQTNTR